MHTILNKISTQSAYRHEKQVDWCTSSRQELTYFRFNPLIVREKK